MKKVIRYSLKAFGWLLGTLVALWLILWMLVEFNEDKLIAKIADTIHQKTYGEVKIGGASVSLLRTFPVLSLQLTDVTIRDSLYHIHHKDFLAAENIYLRISLKDLIHGRSALGRITVSNGGINLLTDSVGRTNEYILAGEKQSEGRESSSVPQLFLNNMHYLYQNIPRHKLYKGTLHQLKFLVDITAESVVLDVGLGVQADFFAFNTRRGSYVQGSRLAGNFRLIYNKRKHDLLINHVQLNIDDHPFYFDGYFRIDRRLSDFNLTVATNDILYPKATSLLTDSLTSRLSAYSFSKPISVAVTITGETAIGHDPDVRIRMNVDMQSVLSAAGITSLQFKKGTTDVDITIVSSDKARDTVNGDLNGSLALHDVDIRYLPKNFMLRNCNGTIRFNSNDVLIDSLRAIAGTTRLLMSGKTRNFITLGDHAPGVLSMVWKIFSPEVHLADFKPFLAAGKFSTKQSSLDKLFSTGNIYINMTTPRMDYNHFRATHAAGQVVLTSSGIQLKKIGFTQSKGTMELNAEMKNGTTLNPLKLHTRMINIDIPQLFASFDNFGQDAITKDNLRGQLSAHVDFNTAITNRGDVMPDKSTGTVDFLLENGELNNFGPLIAVSQKAFKKQDFSDIRFAKLQNRLNISGTTFIVNPMEIRSTAFTFFVEGVYDVKKGTDMSIQLPIRNLTKDQGNTDLSDEFKSKKGMSVRLRAKSDSEGKLKLSWDPFRKAARNRKQASDSMNVEATP